MADDLIDPRGVSGVQIGHWTDLDGETGCTVVTFPEGTVASCEVRGGAPATRELDCLAPDKMVGSIDAAVMTGGSAFGLAAADGVMQRLAERGRGVETPGGRVPIVPTLALFDLAVGDATARPTAESGIAAVDDIGSEWARNGRVGAGTGAYVSHWRGSEGRKHGGLHYAEHRIGELVVGALCAVNAFGDIDDGTRPISFESVVGLDAPFRTNGSRTNTTVGVIITNASIDKIGCHIVAQGAHDGLARAITPPHTRFDGDAFIAAATGQVPAAVDTVRLMALAAVTDSIRSAL